MGPISFFPAAVRGAALLAGLVLATAALAQFNLPPADTSLPGSRPTAPRTGPPPAAPFAAQPMLPAPDNLGLPGIDQRQCGPTAHHALCARGRWTLFSSIDLRVSAPGFAATYTVEIAQNHEVRATYRETAGGKTRSGEILLVGMDGVAYRTQETFPADASIIDTMISSPLLTAQLAALLLDQGVIGPPADVTSPRTIKAASTTQYIRASAPSAALLFAPPWRMTGSARPGATKSDVAFAMKLAYRPVDAKGAAIAGRTDSLALEGSVSFAPRRETLPDSFDLGGFSVLRDDRKLEAQPTVGALRKAIGP